MVGENTDAIPPVDLSVQPRDEMRYNPENFYNLRKRQILETVKAAKKVAHYQNLPEEEANYDSYADFCGVVPITTSNDLFPPQDFFTGNPNEMTMYNSGGSTGKRIKEIAYPHEGMLANIDDHVIGILRSAKNPTLLHKDVHALSYLVTETSLKEQAPNVSLTTYLPAGDVLNKIKNNDVIYVTEQVSKFRELMHDFEKRATQSQEELAKALKGKTFLIEIGSEPIDINEVRKWYGFLQQYTGVEPELWGLYGCTENLLIGIWIYKPSDDHVRYEVKDNRFVEILNKGDEKTVPSGEEGRVIVTPLRSKDYQGTVLLRYDTGDYARVETEGDKMFLSDIRRKPEDGMISVWGHKVYIPQIHDILQADLGFPVSISIGDSTIKDPDSGQEKIVLKTDLYSPDFTDEKSMTEAKEKLVTALTVTIPTIQEFINGHKLAIDVNFGQEAPSDFTKAWRRAKNKI